MIITDNVVSSHLKLIRTTEGQLTLNVIKEYFYDNPMNLMLSWWDRDFFCNPFSISKDEMCIIRTAYENSVSYGSICQALCIGHNIYTGPSIGKRDHINSI